MLDINDISKKINEEKDNLVAKAFTCQIASLLLTNGIVPIMTEYRKENLVSITDKYSHKLVYELGVTFDSLDTSEHDEQIRADVFKDCILENGEYCWQRCVEIEHCQECKCLGNGDINYFS